MTNDPAWDMPLVNWQQQGSFQIPEIPPAYEPDSEPLVCLPAINRYWLPYVMGALDQLRNPSSWLVADDSAMSETLYRVTKLREMIGVGAPCMNLAIRYDPGSCQLQQSTDSGATWTEVDGWEGFNSCLPPQTVLRLTPECELQESFDTGTNWMNVTDWVANFGNCVQENGPIIGLPPNPGDQSPDQLACSIAAYLADQIILDSMGAAVTAIQDDLTLLSMANSILTIIPEFVLVRAFVDGVSIVYTAVAEGTLSDYEDAIADGTLWDKVTCAIYTAIVGDGYVNTSNFAAIVANISGISYAHSDVIDAIAAFVNSLGATGLAQLSQRAGLETGADCSGCGGWCVHIDFSLTSASFTASEGIYSGGGGVGGFDSTGPVGPWEALTIASGSLDGGTTFTTVRVVGSCANVAPSGVRYVTDSVGDTTQFTDLGAGAFDETVAFPYSDNNITISLYSTYNGAGSRITDLYISGTGANPFASRYGIGVTDC